MKIFRTVDNKIIYSSPVVNPPPRIRRILPKIDFLIEKPRKQRLAPFKKTDLARAITTAAKTGVVIGSVEVKPDGTIRIFAAGSEPAGSLFDDWERKL